MAPADPPPTTEVIVLELACGRPGCLCAASARRGAGATHCPSHADRTPSLQVDVKGGTTLVHCMAGCSQDELIAALRERGVWNGTPGPTRRAPFADLDAANPTRPDPVFDAMLANFDAGWAKVPTVAAGEHMGPECSCWQDVAATSQANADAHYGRDIAGEVAADADLFRLALSSTL